LHRLVNPVWRDLIEIDVGAYNGVRI